MEEITFPKVTRRLFLEMGPGYPYTHTENKKDNILPFPGQFVYKPRHWKPNVLLVSDQALRL